MATTTLERTQVTAAMAEAGSRFVGLVRSLSPAEMSTRVPWMEWTVGDVAAHLVTIVRRTYADLERSATPDETARLNARGLSEVEQRDPQWIADQIAAGLDIALRKVWPKIPDDVQVPFHAGTLITISGAGGIVTGEFLMHGFDIATTVGRPWPLPHKEMTLALWGLAEVIHGWLSPAAATVHESFEVHLAGEDKPMTFAFENGALNVSSEAVSAPDHVIQTEPSAFALAVLYKRVPVSEPTMARLSSLLLPA
jgi:uncharacterized protein (TIGR03083 family)